jgi:hypothetical protein
LDFDPIMLRELINVVLGKRRTWVWKRKALKVHDGIRIVYRSLRKDLVEEFAPKVCEALALIASKDPRRYRRVRRYVQFIVAQELDAAAVYYRRPPACLVDFGRYMDRRVGKRVASLLAASIVHEATHGALFHWCPRPDREAGLRMERICMIEQIRFAHRVSAELGAAYSKVCSDWPKWRRAYEQRPAAGSWRKFMAIFRRCQEAARKSNQRPALNAGSGVSRLNKTGAPRRQ